MDKNGTPGWPPAMERRIQERLRLITAAPSADFISQLIAERDGLMPQPDCRQASIGTAVHAYEAGARISVRRLPAGYRKTVVA